MCRRQIAQRIVRLEQTLGSRVEVLTYSQREAVSIETSNLVRASAASRGCFQEGNESLADLFARSLGISCRELKTAFKAGAVAVPVSADRCAPGRRRR
jgi:hypothetical protein